MIRKLAQRGGGEHNKGREGSQTSRGQNSARPRTEGKEVEAAMVKSSRRGDERTRRRPPSPGESRRYFYPLRIKSSRGGGNGIPARRGGGSGSGSGAKARRG
eukprot:4246099-Pyramimonas_sp.AAC.1